MLNHMIPTAFIENPVISNHYKRKTDTGQSLVEFALILGLIVIIFIGSIDIFNLLQQKADLDKMILQAARQAGEFGGAGDGNEVQAYIRAQMNAMEYTPTQITDALDTLEFEARKYDGNTIGDLSDAEVAALGDAECTYGQLITVSMQIEWKTNIPSVLFFKGINKKSFFDVQSTARCWRA